MIEAKKKGEVNRVHLNTMNMKKIKLITFMLIFLNLVGCGASDTKPQDVQALSPSQEETAIQGIGEPGSPEHYELESMNDTTSTAVRPDSLESFVPRDSDCICTDHCSVESIDTDCSVCSTATVETLDSICLGVYPELYNENSDEHYIYFDSEEVYAFDFLPTEVWNALPNSLPIYMQNMGLKNIHELHYVEGSIINTDSEKSFVFIPENEEDIRIKVSYIDGKLDYSMWLE